MCKEDERDWRLLIRNLRLRKTTEARRHGEILDFGFAICDFRNQKSKVKNQKYLVSPCLLFLRALCVFVVIFYFTIPILLPYNATAHSAIEHERWDMRQRASAVLEEVLSTGEFNPKEERGGLWHRLAERSLHRLLGGAGWIIALLEWLLYFITILVTISVLIFIAKRLRRFPSFTTDRDNPIEPQRRMDPKDMTMQAYDCAQRGDFRQAIRYLYLSLLLYLDKAGLLAYDAGKTNGEYFGEIRSTMSDAAERFASLTLFFERKWYGMEESSAEDFRQYEEILIKIVNSR